MIVIDTNILAYHTLEQADPELCRQATRLMSGKTKVLLPSLWRHEFLNALCNYVKAGQMTLEKAQSHWYSTLAIAQAVEAEVDMVRSLALSKELRISAYDAQFLALAEAANTVLVTEDKRLRVAAGTRTRSMAEQLAA